MNQDHFFMGKALALAQEALQEGQFPVGCLIRLDDAILTTSRRQASSGGMPSEITHAEILALRNLEQILPREKRRAATLYATMEPCLMCYGAILLSGIGRIVWAYEDVMGGGTACRLEDLPPLYADSHPEILPHCRREESLALFKLFFLNPANTYWKESLLARYTLETP